MTSIPSKLLRPVTETHVREPGFLVSPRFIERVREAAPFAIIGYGSLTALPSQGATWARPAVPGPLPPKPIVDALPLPALACDIVYDGWADAEDAIIAPESLADVDALAARLDRRWYWRVDGDGRLELVDRTEGMREPLGQFAERTGPAIFRPLECPFEPGLPSVRAEVGRERLQAEVIFDSDVRHVYDNSSQTVLRVPDPTPEAGPRLTGERIEILVDAGKLVIGDLPAVEITLSATVRLFVLRNRSVLPALALSEIR